MLNAPLLAKKKIEAARRFSQAVYDELAHEDTERRQTYAAFYNNLALFSGGTIALSVTYLGYLKTLPSAVLSLWSLVGAWSSLLLCLITSLFHSLFHPYYMHHARSKEYSEKQQKEFETEKAELANVRIAEFSTKQEYEDYARKLTDAAQVLRDDAAWHGRREKAYEYIWVWNSRVARLSFIAGLGLLLFFAISNL